MVKTAKIKKDKGSLFFPVFGLHKPNNNKKKLWSYFMNCFKAAEPQQGESLLSPSVFLTRGMGGVPPPPPAKHLLSPPPGKIPLHQIFVPFY